mmetsp:Transcript_3691/g.12897  ORF Transcript_3691/g.12897 Transcript_3691/m.12897 type:complete len:239 (+) Transcript_3691:806-1522(+)
MRSRSSSLSGTWSSLSCTAPPPLFSTTALASPTFATISRCSPPSPAYTTATHAVLPHLLPPTPRSPISPRNPLAGARSASSAASKAAVTAAGTSVPPPPPAAAPPWSSPATLPSPAPPSSSFCAFASHPGARSCDLSLLSRHRMHASQLHCGHSPPSTLNTSCRIVMRAAKWSGGSRPCITSRPLGVSAAILRSASHSSASVGGGSLERNHLSTSPRGAYSSLCRRGERSTNMDFFTA